MADIGIIKFQLAGIHFGIYADDILEIIRYTGVRPIPRPLPYVVGLMKLRKYIVTVVDVRKRLGLPSVPLLIGTTVIVANLPSGKFGLLVEAISEFQRVPPELILPSISVAGFPEHLLRGVVADRDEILILPDFHKIFSSYINVRLTPISPSEKLAFQYRFTPGALTRTLENTLITQPYLDERIIRKLPHSMNMSSVLVSKITSYYPDFALKRVEFGQQTPHSAAKTIKAGDETYFSLSQQLFSKQEQRTRRQRGARQSTMLQRESSRTGLTDIMDSDLIENLLHGKNIAELSSEKEAVVSKEARDIQPETGRQIAKHLQISSAHLTRYLTFHAAPDVTQFPAISHAPHSHISHAQQAEERLNTLLATGCPLGETLQTLGEEQQTLTRQQVQAMCRHYHLSPAKFAKILSFFPTLSYAIEAEILSPHRDNPPEETSDAPPQSKNSMKKMTKPTNEFLLPTVLVSEKPAASISLILYHLADAQKLEDDSTLRSIASQLHISTCRFSKLRSYYQFHG